MLIDSKRPFFGALVFLIVFLSGIIIYLEYQKITDENRIVIYTGAGKTEIRVEYATTAEKQKQGLAGRASLPKNSGMIFIFPDEKIREFWMKNTLIPLEIMFIGTNGHIHEIITMKPCPEDVEICPIYTSKESARFAIEVNAGFATKNRIIEGDILEISGF